MMLHTPLTLTRDAGVPAHVPAGDYQVHSNNQYQV